MKRINLVVFASALFAFIYNSSFGQIIYQHDFNSGIVAGSASYTTAPPIMEPSLSSTGWSTAPTTFTTLAGATGAALSLSNSQGSPTYSLALTIASGYTCDISAFSFWNRHSGSGANSWTLSVNNSTTIGNGTSPATLTTGMSTGTLAVSNPATGLSGTINLVLQLAGGTSSTGTFRLDDFTLYGVVSPTATCTPPTIQSSVFSSSSVGTNSVTLNWTSGNGGNAIVLAKQSSSVNATPSSGLAYTANSIFGSGQQIGTGNYVVYNGTGNSVTVTGLNSGTDYYFSVIEYNTTTGTPCYLTPALTGSVTTDATPTSTNCLQIKSILVAACGAPESYNEMVYFKNGPNPLPIDQISIAGAPASGVFSLNKWPNNGNSWFGLVQNTLTASNVNAINASITNCGYAKEPPLVSGIGTIPANANVILVGHQSMNPLANSFVNLTDTVYIIFQAAATSTAGNFTNSGAGTRGFVLIDNLHGCTSNSITYIPASLATGGNNGDAISFDVFNNISYYNSGCQAPFIPLSVDAGNNQTICYNATAVLSGTASGTYNSVLWSGGSGTFSTPTSLTTTYTPGVTETGTIKLYCSITRSCATSSTSNKDSIYISITSLPVFSFNASNGYSLCPSATSVISYSVSNAANAGTLTPSWSLPASSETTYTVSSPSGTVSVNYTLNLSNMCGSTTHTFDVFPLAAPSVSLSANTLTACPGNTMSLTATSNSGNYSWNNPVSTNSTVIITASTSTTGVVTTTNVCGSAQDSYTLTVTPTATLTVDNPSVTLCSGQSATITATSNTGTYTWTPGPLNTNSIVVNSNGSYTVSTANVCNSASVAVNVLVNATPVLSISATSSSVCSGGQINSILSLVGSTGTYSWSSGATTSTISISIPGIYTATVDAGTCGTATASIDITPIVTPTISAVSSSSLICDGATATLTANSNMSNYGWSTGETSVSTITVNATNTYTVGVSNACGTASASINVVALNTPVLNLTGSSTTICPNETTTLTVSGGTEPYVWSNSANTTSVNTVSTEGTVSVMNSNACGADTKTIMINVIPNPTITLSQPSYTVCEGDAVSVVANSSEGNYSWLPFTNTTNTLTFTPSASTTGMVTTTNVCTSVSDTYSIIVISSPTIAVTPSLTSVCPGQSVTLTADSDVPMYTWQPGGATTNTILASGGGYTVSTSNVCFTVSAISSVQVNSSPTLSISASSPSVCSNGSAVSTLSLTGSAGTYLWSNGATDYTTSISSPGIYTATVTTAGCGTAPASFTIDAIPDPTISVVATSTLLCNGQTATLTASSDMSNFSWSTGQIITHSITVNSTNTYTVGVSNSCKTVTTSINVVADNTPTLNLTASSTTLCPNETATLTVTGGIEPYTWSNTSSTGSVVTTSGGTVTATYSNVCGSDIKSVVVVVSNLSADIAANPQSGVVPVQVDYTNNSVGATTYTWNFGNSNTATTQTVSVQTYSNVGEYYAYLLVSDGVCFDKDSVLINVLDIEPIFEIPNVFTPNADSVNDIFMIKKYYHIVDLNCIIYDRWGLQMYSWEGINYGWDGKSDGKDVPAGTYFYIINAKDIDGKEIKKQGSVNLFR